MPSNVPTASVVAPNASLEARQEWFEAVWRKSPSGSPPPRWQEYLPPADVAWAPDFAVLLIQTDIEFRVKAGFSASLTEDYFQHPRLQADDAQLSETQKAQVIRWEYQQRWKHGDRAKRQVYVEHFPEHAAALRELRPAWNCPDCKRLAIPLQDEAAQEAVCPFCHKAHQVSILFPSAPGQPAMALAGTGPLPKVPGYQVLGIVGQGGMGVVYKAEQNGLNRFVALKMIRTGANADAEELTRFRNEARVLAQLEHPNIVGVYEVGEHDGQPFISLEFVNGGRLSDKISGTAQPPRATAHLVATLARGVHCAHQHGIIHRDLKPSNILLAAALAGNSDKAGNAAGLECYYGLPKITDFGLAKKLLTQQAATTEPTPTGTVMGTPSYMSPEQAEANTALIGPATDIYSLGATLYDMLTGQPPFVAATMLETVLKVIREEPVPPSQIQPRVPRDLETICLHCLHKEPARRYSDAKALADDLERYLAGEPILARPNSAWERIAKWARRQPTGAALVGTGAVAFLGLLVGGWMYNAVVVGGIAVISLLAGAWFYSARLQAALRQLAQKHNLAERQVERVALLLETTCQLMSVRDLGSLLHLISQTATRLANAERASIFLIDQDRGELWSRVALGQGLRGIRLPLGTGIAGTVAVTGETINIPDAYADARFNREIDRQNSYRTRNLLTLPMRSRDDRIIGVFQVLNKRGGGFATDDVDILTTLANAATIAIENTQPRPA